MKNDVFISYSREDIKIAKGLCEVLRQNGVDYWIDDNDIHGSANFLSEITKNLKQCKAVIFVASANSAASEWTQKELLFAIKHSKDIIPYKIGEFSFDDNDELDFVFSNVQWVDSIDKVIVALREKGFVGMKPAPQPPIPPVPPTFKTYKVGDYYDDGTKQGVVFDVWDDGQHGKIVSLDQAESCWADDSDWSFCFNKNSPIRKTVGCCNFNDGMANMIMIRQIVGWRDKYPAFVWCCSKGKDWYLPAINELELLLLNDSVLDAVNCALNKYGKLICVSKKYCYWSSTEDERRYSYGIEPYSGWISGDKMNDYYVRAVATF